MCEAVSEALGRGAERFDRGEWFVAHEIWEERWRGSQDPAERLLLQGLIQVAAGYYKYVVQGRPASAARLLARGLDKLERCTAAVDGIDLASFCQRTRGQLEAVGRGELDVSDVPRLR